MITFSRPTPSKNRVSLSLLPLLFFSFYAPAAEVVTKRFGENVTCQATGVTSDTSLAKAAPDENFGTEQYLHFRPGPDPKNPWHQCTRQEIMIMRFDLSSLPPKTKIKKATLRLFDRCNGVSDGSLEILRITDPDRTGIWDPKKATYNKKDKDKNVPWSKSGAGDIYSALATGKIGDLDNRNWSGGAYKLFNFADGELEVKTVQDWVDNPSGNLGFFITLAPDKDGKLNVENGIGSSRIHDEAFLRMRPYLEVTYESTSGQYETIPQPERVSAKFHSGETFITWPELSIDKPEVSYRIYRSTKGPIADVNAPDVEFIDEVWNGSAFVYIGNFLPTHATPARGIHHPDLSRIGIALDDTTGLYVLPIEEDKPTHGYYAVTTVINGNENTKLTKNTADSDAEKSGVPDAFPLAIPGNLNPKNPMWQYIMYVGRHNPLDRKDRYGFSNLRSIPFAFLVRLPGRAVAKKKISLQDGGPLLADDKINGAPVKYPVTTCAINSHAGSLGAGGYGCDCIAAELATKYDEAQGDAWDYGGFMLRFAVCSYSRKIVRTPDNRYLDQGPGVGLATPGGHDACGWYTGYNNGFFCNSVYFYFSRKNGAEIDYAANEAQLKDFKYAYTYTPGHKEYVPQVELRSVPYFEKSALLSLYWLKYKSPWGEAGSKNVDLNRQYLNGEMRGYGFPLALWLHYPKLFSAAFFRNPIAVPFSRQGDASFYGFGPDGLGHKLPTVGVGLSSVPGDPLNPELAGLADMTIDDYYDPLPLLQKNLNRNYPPALVFHSPTGAEHSPPPPFTPAASMSGSAASGKLQFTEYWGVHWFGEGDLKKPEWEESGFPELTPHFRLSRDPKSRTFSWNLQDYRLNRSFLAFTNFQVNGANGNDDPAKTDKGGINRWVMWDVDNVKDTKTAYSVKLFLNQAAPYKETDKVTVDVTPRRLQAFTVETGKSYHWKVSAGGKTLAEGEAKADQYGRLTVPNVAVPPKTGSTLELTGK